MQSARHRQPQTHIITVPPLIASAKKKDRKSRNVIKSIDFTMLAASALLPSPRPPSTWPRLHRCASCRRVRLLWMQEDPNVRRFVDSMAEVSAPDTPADIKAAPDVEGGSGTDQEAEDGKEAGKRAGPR